MKQKTSQEVVQNLTELLKEEKRISDHILVCLEEVETRKIYAEMGYPSLFEMLVKHFNLNENSAYTRISAMRLIKSVPEARLALIKNQVSMSTLAQVQSFIKQEEKTHHKKLNLASKIKLIEQIKGKSHKQVKRELTLLNPDFGTPKEKERILNERETQVTLVIDCELKAKLQKIKALISHKNTNPSYQELLTIMADEMLVKLEKQKSAQTQTSSKRCVTGKARTRYIPTHIKKIVWQRDQGKCQYQKTDGGICGSQYFLQMDHLEPYSQGGANTSENLQLLCATHNQYKWRARHKIYGL